MRSFQSRSNEFRYPDLLLRPRSRRNGREERASERAIATQTRHELVDEGMVEKTGTRTLDESNDDTTRTRRERS